MEQTIRRSGRIPGWGQVRFVGHAMRKAVAAMLALKDKGFEEEKEWRLVVDEGRPRRFRTGRFGILPYCAIPLCLPSQEPPFTDVYIGPHPEPNVAHGALFDFLRTDSKIGNPAERIKQSAIPYRY
jgi:hypothetical protein